LPILTSQSSTKDPDHTRGVARKKFTKENLHSRIQFPGTALLKYYTVTVLLNSLTALLEYIDVSSGIVQIATDPALIFFFVVA